MPKYSSIKYRNQQRARYYAKHRIGKVNASKAWSIIDETLVEGHVMPDVELSKLIGRSVEAIQIKRCRLKK